MSFNSSFEDFRRVSDKDKWSNLVCQTISALCRNGMIGCDVVKVQGLIGITLCNKEVFLVEISECFEAGSNNNNVFINSDNSSPPKAKSRKRKSSHPRSSKPAEETFSQDGESNNDMDFNIASSYDFQVGADTNYSNENLIIDEDNHREVENCLDQIQYIENNRNRVEFSTFETKYNPMSVPHLGSLVADAAMQNETPYQTRKVKRRELSHGVAMTKHTAELLGYQEFSPSLSRPYSCRLCEASFSKKFCLANHIVTVHQIGGKYICKHCGRQFLQRNRYMLHLDRHNDSTKLICQNCGKITLKSNYETHLKKCSGSGRRETGIIDSTELDEEEVVDGNEAGVGVEDSQVILPGVKIKQEDILEYESEMDG